MRSTQLTLAARPILCCVHHRLVDHRTPTRHHGSGIRLLVALPGVYEPPRRSKDR